MGWSEVVLLCCRDSVVLGNRAIYLDWHCDLNWTDERGVRDLLLPPKQFAEVMRSVGIGDDSQVVAYAETDHSGAARLWWALRYYGHDQVALLNGGWTKWVKEGRVVSTGIPHSMPAIFTPVPRPDFAARCVSGGAHRFAGRPRRRTHRSADRRCQQQ